MPDTSKRQFILTLFVQQKREIRTIAGYAPIRWPKSGQNRLSIPQVFKLFSGAALHPA
jgi:hypothetical protein